VNQRLAELGAAGGTSTGDVVLGAEEAGMGAVDVGAVDVGAVDLGAVTASSDGNRVCGRVPRLRAAASVGKYKLPL
jgi:hypothetical protein